MIFELIYTCAINIFYVNDSDFYVHPCRGGKQVKSAPNQIGLSQIGPKSNRPQVKSAPSQIGPKSKLLKN